MWSGDPQYTQWALNPTAYQNVAHEEGNMHSIINFNPKNKIVSLFFFY